MQKISQRSFLKMLATAAGAAGLAAAGQVAVAPRHGEAADATYDVVTINTALRAGAGNLIQWQNSAGAAIGGFDAQNTRVGIGTTQPTETLHLSAVPNQSGLRITGAATSDAIGFFLENLDTGGRTYSMKATGGAAAAGQGKLVIKDETGNATRLVLVPAGDVGIGTTSPGGRLDVAGGQVALDNGDYGAVRGVRFRNTTDTTTPTGGGVYQANNNEFYVEAGSANIVNIRGVSGVVLGRFDGVGLSLAAGSQIKPSTGDSATALKIATYGGTPFVTFDSANQRVGIGTTSPVGKLDVAGPVYVNGVMAIASDGIAVIAAYAP